MLRYNVPADLQALCACVFDCVELEEYEARTTLSSVLGCDLPSALFTELYDVPPQECVPHELHNYGHPFELVPFGRPGGDGLLYCHLVHANSSDERADYPCAWVARLGKLLNLTRPLDTNGLTQGARSTEPVIATAPPGWSYRATCNGVGVLAPNKYFDARVVDSSEWTDIDAALQHYVDHHIRLVANGNDYDVYRADRLVARFANENFTKLIEHDPVSESDVEMILAP